MGKATLSSGRNQVTIVNEHSNDTSPSNGRKDVVICHRDVQKIRPSMIMIVLYGFWQEFAFASRILCCKLTSVPHCCFIEILSEAMAPYSLLGFEEQLTNHVQQ